jgi:hypothetical protein
MDPILEVAKALAPDPEVPNLTLRWGVITVVNSDGTASLRLGGSAVVSTSVKALGSYHPVVNDVVCILTNGPDLIIIGTVAPSGSGELWMPAREFDASLGAPTYASFGGWATNQWGWHLVNGTDSGVIGHTYLPSDYVPGSTITGDILFTCGSGGNVKIDSQMAAVQPGTDAMNSTGAIPPGVSNVVAPTGLEQLILGGGGTPSGTPAPGCLLNIAVDRNGGNVADTNAAIVTFHGVRLRYTRYRL